MPVLSPSFSVTTGRSIVSPAFSVTTSTIDEIVIGVDVVPQSLFYRDIKLSAPMAPTSVIEYHVKQTLIDFCRETRYWQVELNPISINRLTPRYRLDHSAGVVTGVLQVDVTSVDFSIHRDIKPDSSVDRFTYSMASPSVISFSAHQELESAEVRVAMQPSQQSTDCPAIVYEQYYETVVCGAKARILSIPGKEWTDLQSAGIENNRYYQGRSMASIEANQRYVADLSPRPDVQKDYF